MDTENKSLQLVEGSMQLISSVPDAIQKHEASLAKAKQAYAALIDKIGANGDRLNDDLDTEAKDLIIKIKKTKDIRQQDREPITQIFDAIKKKFTAAEKELIALTDGLQVYRNDFVTWKKKEAERLEKERQVKVAIENAKADLTAYIIAAIGQKLNDYLFSKKQQWQQAFNTIPLENFDEKSGKLASLATGFNQSKLGEILQYQLPATPLLKEPDIIVCRENAHKSYDFKAWIESHDQQLTELKNSLMEQLPSKLQELQAEAAAKAAAEQARKEAEEREAQRQAEIANANAAEKKRLEAQAEIDRANEAKRQAELKAEQDRLAKEKADRESAEAQRQAMEKAEADRKAKEQADIAAASAKAATLFDIAADAEPVSTTETREAVEINVLHAAGWMEIFQFWYLNEGVKLPIQDMGKKSLNQMKAFCEKQTKSTGEMIKSNYLEYKDKVTAVNRK